MEKTLKQFAGFLKDHHLDELAAEDLRIILSMDIPLMRMFAHLSEPELLEMAKKSLTAFLTGFEEGKEIENARAGMEKWERNETPGISRKEIGVHDLIYIYAAQKQALINFLPRYTTGLSEAISIIEEIENYYSNVQTMAFSSLIRIHNQEIAESEEKFRLMAENATDMIFRASPDGTLLYVSPSSIAITGYTPEELTGRKLHDLFFEDQKAMTGTPEIPGIPASSERTVYRCKGKNDSLTWVETTTHPLKDNAGEIIEIHGTTRDITEKKISEEQLVKNERLLNETQRIAKLGSWEWDFTTNNLQWSEEHYHLYGFNPSRPITYEDAQKVAYKEEKGIPLGILQQAMVEKKIVEFYHRIIKYDTKEVRILFVKAEPVTDATGKVVKLRGISQDVTELKRAEEELKVINEQLTDAQHIAHLGNWEWSIGTGKVSCSREIFNMLGMPGDYEPTYENFLKRLLPDDVEEVKNQLESTLTTHEPYNAYQRVTTNDGTVKIIHCRGNVVTDAAGTVIKLRGTAQDVTEHKRIEENLLQRTRELDTTNKELEKSNSDLMQFASVASHDLKEPLRKIQTFGDLLSMRFGPVLDEDGRSYLEKIVDASSRMQALINDLLTFSRLSNVKKAYESTDLNVLINEILHDLEIAVKERNAGFRIEKLPVLEVIPGQIRQVFQNLITNALKFTREGVFPEIRIYSETDAEYCRIYVEDNGIGFDEKYLDRIFTIFQRLHPREEYEGTGIGLAICKKVIENHNGLITASSQPGKGSTFILSLPLRQTEKIKNKTATFQF